MSRNQPQAIGDVLSQLMARRGYARLQAQGVLAEAWSTAAGPQLAAVTRAGRIWQGVLEVTATSSVAVQELSFRRVALLARLGELLPEHAIRELRFRVGRVSD